MEVEVKPRGRVERYAENWDRPDPAWSMVRNSVTRDGPAGNLLKVEGVFRVEVPRSKDAGKN